MRTTINIATPVFKELKALRDKEGGTLGDVVSRLPAEALKTRRVSPAAFPWSVPNSNGTASPCARLDLATRKQCTRSGRPALSYTM